MSTKAPPLRRIPRKSFLDAVLQGLGSASLFVAGAHPIPRTPPGSIADDWRAVGNDLRQAMQGYRIK